MQGGWPKLAASWMRQSTPAAGPSVSIGKAETGPVIENYGPVYAVPDGSYNLDAATHYKVLFDISKSGEFAMAFNPSMDSAARFLNMHARNGIDMENIELALVVHGEAARDVLTDEAYRDRFGVVNPNSRMVEQFRNVGVRIYLCGQSAMHKGFTMSELNPAVTMAVSAMTAHVRLQAEGFRLMPF